ncbi:NAD-dependent epimerase/dehydratase family protein [Filibacter tadaridae]
MDNVGVNRKKLMITGANGFTGRHACTYFSAKGYNVIAVVRNELDTVSSDRIQIERCDVTDKTQVNVLIAKTRPDFLLHLAGQNHVQNSWEDPLSSYESNIMSTAYLLDAVRNEQNACRIVVVGSALQFNPNNLSTLPHPYSFSKTLQMLMAQSYEALFGMNVLIAKPTNLIGPGLSTGVCTVFANRVARMEIGDCEKILMTHNLNAQRDFLDVRDAVHAYEILLQTGEKGHIYTVSTGIPRYLKEITRLYRSMTTVEFDIITETDNKEILEPVLPTPLVGLGWKPKIAFNQSLKDILDDQRRRLANRKDESS